MDQQLHLIAVGGSVMHNLAIALHQMGHTVTGSDDAIYQPSRGRLEKYGLLPDKDGWDDSRVHEGIDAVILGMHARVDNPELLKAQQLAIPVYSFPEFVFRMAQNKMRVAICGSHGKTSVTAMVMHALKAAGREIDYLVGAQLAGFEVMVRFSEADTMILEGDEYLASKLLPEPKFLSYKPQLALITGIAWDHINVFPTFENYLDQFRKLTSSLGASDTLIYNATDEHLRSLVEEGCAAKLIPYQAPTWQLEDGAAVINFEGADYRMGVFGQHNMENLEAARNICGALGIAGKDFYTALTSFSGAAKRLELLATGETTAVYKDFAHSPSKVAATVDAVSAQFPGRQLTACLELHTFSSLTAEFLKQYAGSMDKADRAIVCYDPKVIEAKRLPAITDQQVKEAFANQGLEVITDTKKLEQLLKNEDWESRNLLMMSSGNFHGLDMVELANFVVRSTKAL